MLAFCMLMSDRNESDIAWDGKSTTLEFFLLRRIVIVFEGHRTVKVGIAISRQAAMTVMGLENAWLEVVPFVRHDLLDIACRERSVLPSRFFPVMKNGAVQWRHPLCSLCWHLDYLHDIASSPIPELLEQIVHVVNGSAVQDERQWGNIQSGCRWPQNILDVMMQHALVDAAHSHLFSLGWRKDLRRKDVFCGAAGDHVKACTVGCGVRSFHHRSPAGCHESVVLSSVQALVSLVQEQQLLLWYAPELTTQFRHSFAMISRHCTIRRNSVCKMSGSLSVSTARFWSACVLCYSRSSFVRFFVRCCLIFATLWPARCTVRRVH